MLQGLLKCFLLIDFITFTRAKYVIFKEFPTNNITSEWVDSNTQSLLPINLNQVNEAYIGQQSAADSILYWKRTFNMAQTKKIYFYFEYSLIGQWNNNELLIYANDLNIYNVSYTLIDKSITNQALSNYNSYVFLVIKSSFDILNLEIQANQHNVGLFIKNLFVMQQTQVGRDEFISYRFDIIPGCPADTYYCAYYCNCTHYTCAPVCPQNQLLDDVTNTCYTVEHCSDCEGPPGDPPSFTCDDGYYAQQNHITLRYRCVSQCSNKEFQNQLTGWCDDLQAHLQKYDNKGYNVDHYFFFKDIVDFFHFFLYPDISISVVSFPYLEKDRNFVYHNNRFVIGSLVPFQEQNIELITEITTQHQLHFRATAYFIDFYPSSLSFTINGFTQILPILQINLIDQGDASKADYISYIYYIQKRDLSPAPVKNDIVINIQQPLQGGSYQGYFYLEDVHFFQLQCITGCDKCYSIDFCPPCTYPLHKNPLDCSCDPGYSNVQDQCVICPSYCNLCVAAYQCNECQVSTKRINPPACTTCPDSYFVQNGIDNCQPCIDGCKKCVDYLTCQYCLPTYYRSDSNKCIKTCPSYQFQDTSVVTDPKCTNCDANCLTCQTTATYCTDCASDKLLIDNKCYNCPLGQYLSNKTCLNCITNCQSCTSPICILCKDPYFYKSSTNQCIATCDPGYYGNFSDRKCTNCFSRCATCAAGTQNDCLSCFVQDVLNKMDLVKGQCASNCLLGFYRDGSYCLQCWKGCKSCVDNTQACIACATNYYRSQVTGFCYDVCPDGFYNQKSSGFCSPCNNRCATCNNVTEFSCLSCASPLSYYQNQCLDECPDGYGSSNQVCVVCTPNCKKCFGTQFNECLECTNGYYYLNHQCYVRCPRTYKGVRPAYICKCIYDNCLTCLSNEFYLNNACYTTCPDGYFGYNNLCIICDVTCKTCYNESDENCLTCQTGLIFYQNSCYAECFGNTYPDYTLNECLLCNDACIACTGPLMNNCTACVEGKVLQTAGICADNCLSNEYLVYNEQRCHLCHPTCKTCFGQTYQQCLTCNNLFYINECVDVCPAGFKISDNLVSCEPDFSLVISQCSYQCNGCKLTPRFCTNCAANRFTNAPSCDCREGYYDDGSNALCKLCDNICLTCYGSAKNCIKCKGDRLLAKCQCPLFTYDDLISTFCIACQDNCKTCDQTGCLTCKGDRIQSPDCICTDGYFESYKYFCEECDTRCETCIGTSQICSKCSGLRVKPPVCQCPIGYYETKDEECDECNPTCIECYSGGCVTCFGNRSGPNLGVCDCQEPAVSRLNIGSLYCTDCDLGVPYFGVNTNFTGFTIDFGGQVQLNIDVNQEICGQIFDTNTLTLLGNETTCDQNLNVIFGSTATIHVGDTIQMLPTFFLNGCQKQFTSVLPNKLQIPTSYDLNSYLPQIQFNQNDDQNICDDTLINFQKLFFNGNQQFKIINWTFKSPLTDTNQTIIQHLLDLVKQNQSNFVIFPILTFKPDLNYKFEINIQSFANLQNTQTITVVTQARSKIFFDPLASSSQTVFRYNEIVIDSLLQYKNCYEKNPPVQLLTYEVVFKPTSKKIISGNFTENLVDGFFQDIQFRFPPYTFNFSIPLTFVFNAVLQRPDYTVKYSIEYTIKQIPTLPVLVIQGGNRIIGFSDKLLLNASIKDIDYSEQENLNSIYPCNWICNDIVTGAACQNMNMELIEFSNSCYQSLPAKTFSPYSVVIFKVTIIKADTEYTTKAAIQVVETNLPVLTVEGPSQTATHNYYDELYYKLIYPGINPDNIMYAGAVIYDSVVQATFQFFYLELKFKLQNYFSDFWYNISNSTTLRLSIYDPRFILPSISNQVIIVNIPPKSCQLHLQAPKGFTEFLDELQIQVTGCTDTDLPLEYSVVIFPNMSIYQQNILTSRFYDQFLIRPYQQNNSFNVRLPYFSDKEVVIVVLIQDSQIGITNVTTTLPIKELINFNTTKEIEDQIVSDNFDVQLILYNLITERLKQVVGMLDLREKIYRQLVGFIKANTYTNNRTESMYSSVSNLLMVNMSLLGLNETLDLEQLNISVIAAYTRLDQLFQLQQEQSLSSQNNLEKNTLLKLYISFMNILSSWNNYRISLKKDSSDVQNLLNQIQEQIQSISVANEPLYQVFTSSIDLNFGYLSEKLTNSVTGSKVHSQSSSTKGSLFTFSMTRFYNNPFQTTKQFPQNSTNYSVIIPQIKENGSQGNVEMKAAVNFKFPVEQKINITQQCIAQSSTTSEWSAEVCQTKTVNNEVICSCEKLSPTSLMDQLSYIANKGEQVFSLDTLSKFGTFPFYETVIFYFYIIFTLTYIYAVSWGIRIDNSMFSKVEAQPEIENLKAEVDEPQILSVSVNQVEQADQQQSQDTQNMPQFQRSTIFRKNNTLKSIFSNKPQNKLQVITTSQPQFLTEVCSKQNLEEIERTSQNQKTEQQNKSQVQQIVGLRNLLLQRTITYMKALLEYIKFFHQILQILYKSDKSKPRGLRATIVYTSFLGSLAVIFIFNQPDNISFNLTLIILTAPANKIYQIILEKLLSHPKKAVRIVGVGFMISSSGLISYVMLAGLVMMDSVETANKWSAIFLASFFSDNLIYSPIQLVIQYLIQMELIKLPFFKTILEKILDDTAKEFLYGLANTIQQI